MREKFGEILKELRKEAGLSQAELAEKLGVHMQTVSRWERNTSEPDMSTYKELSETLSAPLEKLWGVPIPEKPAVGYFDQMRLGKAIYSERKKRGEKQDELAGVAMVSADTVSKWERGLICPDIDALLTLAEHFGVFPSELYYARSAEEVKAPEPPAHRGKPSRKKAGLIAACASLLLIVLATVMLAVFLVPADSEGNKTVCRHEYREETVEATCLAIGRVTKTCTRCGDKQTSRIAKLPHTVGDWIVDKEATCTDAGSEHTECTACHSKIETKAIDKLRHDYKAKFMPAEGDEPDYYLCTCKRCGDSYKANADLEFEFNGYYNECYITGIKNKTVTSIVIPASVDGFKVRGIEQEAFNGCADLREIIIPDSVTSIGFKAFRGCVSLREIVIPDSVTSIWDGAFTACTKLTEIDIPDSVTHIGSNAFMSCTSLTRVKLPANLTEISSELFGYCDKLETVTIPPLVTAIRYYAFYNCKSLQRVVLPEGISTIGHGAFVGCPKLQKVEFGQTKGWTAKVEIVGLSNETALDSDVLANPAAAAEYLTTTYCGYTWYRE